MRSAKTVAVIVFVTALVTGAVAYAATLTFTANKVTTATIAATPTSPTPTSTNPPTVVITFPTEGTNYTTSTAWNAGCGTSTTADICGTATPFTGRTITTLSWRLTKSYGTNTDCFVKSPSPSWQGSCTTPTSNAMTAGTSWSDTSLVFGNGSGQLNQNLNNGETATYTLVVTATDSTGATGSATRTFKTTK